MLNISRDAIRYPGPLIEPRLAPQTFPFFLLIIKFTEIKSNLDLDISFIAHIVYCMVCHKGQAVSSLTLYSILPLAFEIEESPSLCAGSSQSQGAHHQVHRDQEQHQL